MSQLSLNALLTGFVDLFDQNMTAEAARDWLLLTAEPQNVAPAIAVAASTLREHMARVAAPENAIDVCGTGGDGQHTLNVSTAVAIVVAACGVPVAKHGNRAASSLAGGADTLEALGLNLENASARAEHTLADMQLAFLFAQKHHPALKCLAPIRKAIGAPTVLNYIGPLCNPARVTRQLVGVANKAVFDHFTQVDWQSLGMERVMVVCGAEGLDELSISGPSHVFAHGFEVADTITPEDAGLPRHPLEALKGGDAAHNAEALRQLLLTAPDQNLAYRDAVLLNAAAALIVAGEAHSWREGVEEAAEVLDKGLANALLQCWIKACD